MKTKNKILSVLFVAAIAVAAAWNFSQNQDEVTLSDLALENVEALAGEVLGPCTAGCRSVGWGWSQILKCTCGYTGIFSSCNQWGCVI